MARKHINKDEFTPWEQNEIFAIVEKFGNDNKVELRRRLLFLLREDRKIMHGKLSGKIKQLFLNLEQ
jgi:hypothetical protein